jgi:hypothetical protein
VRGTQEVHARTQRTQTRVHTHVHNCGVCEICWGPIKRGYFLTSIKIKKHLEGIWKELVTTQYYQQISHHSILPTNFVTWLSNNFKINWNVFRMMTHVLQYFYTEPTMPLFSISVVTQFKPRTSDLRSWKHPTSTATGLQAGKYRVRFPGEVRDFALFQSA